MANTIYVILEEVEQDLGDGYHSCSPDMFVGIAKDFDTARNVIEYMTDFCIGEENPNYAMCNDCRKSCCEDCKYHNHATVDNEDWDQICMILEDIYESTITYYFRKVQI